MNAILTWLSGFPELMQVLVFTLTGLVLIVYKDYIGRIFFRNIANVVLVIFGKKAWGDINWKGVDTKTLWGSMMRCTKSVYEFINGYSPAPGYLLNDLQVILNLHRERQREIVLNFIGLDVNSYFISDMIDFASDVIKSNNIKVLMIFPENCKDNIQILYDRICGMIEQSKTKSIKVKTDRECYRNGTCSLYSEVD